jgi:hypothetical protein
LDSPDFCRRELETFIGGLPRDIQRKLGLGSYSYSPWQDSRDRREYLLASPVPPRLMEVVITSGNYLTELLTSPAGLQLDAWVNVAGASDRTCCTINAYAGFGFFLVGTSFASQS